MTSAWMRRILERYGQAAALEHAGEERPVRAFLQPVPERDETQDGAVTGLGTVDERLWQYLGQAAVEAGDVLRWEGFTFRVRSSRPWYLGTELVYWWASLELAKEAAE